MFFFFFFFRITEGKIFFCLLCKLFAPCIVLKVQQYINSYTLPKSSKHQTNLYITVQKKRHQIFQLQAFCFYPMPVTELSLLKNTGILSEKNIIRIWNVKNMSFIFQLDVCQHHILVIEVFKKIKSSMYWRGYDLPMNLDGSSGRCPPHAYWFRTLGTRMNHLCSNEPLPLCAGCTADEWGR